MRSNQTQSNTKSQISQLIFDRGIYIPVGLFLIALFPFVRALLLGGHTVYRQTKDFLRIFSFDILTRHALANGQWLLWNPYINGGAPGLSDPATQSLYPPVLLLRLMPISIAAAYNWDAVFHVWLAGLGMYLLLRTLEVSRPAAAFSAISYMFSGVIFARFYSGHPLIMHSMAWPAWIFAFYIRLLKTRLWRHVLSTAFFSALEALARPHPHYLIMIFILPISYFFVFTTRQIISRKWRYSAYILAASVGVTIFTVGLIAVQYIPTVEMFTLSRRGSSLFFPVKAAAFDANTNYARYAISLGDLGTTIVPYLWYYVPTWTRLGFLPLRHCSAYVGLQTFAFVIMGFLARDKTLSLKMLYFSVMALLGVLLAVNNSPLFRLIHLVMPFIYAAARFIYLWVFCIAVLSGLGLEAIIRLLKMPEEYSQKKVSRLQTALIGSAIICLVATAGWRQYGPQLTSNMQLAGYFESVEGSLFTLAQQRNLCQISMTMLALAAYMWMGIHRIVPLERWSWLVIGSLLMEMYIFVWLLTVPQSLGAVYDLSDPMLSLDISPSIVRLETDESQPRAIVHIAHRIPVIGIRDPFVLKTTSDLIEELGMNGGRGSQLFAGGFVLKRSGVKQSDLETIQQTELYTLYRYPDMWPRIYAATTIQLSENQEALTLLRAKDFDPFQTAIVSPPDENLKLSLPPPDNSASFDAIFTDYQINSIQAKVELSKPMMVIFSEIYYPGWKAWVDGNPVRIWRTNYAFRGIVISEGTHLVEMKFEPNSVYWGWRITLLTLILMLLLGFVGIWRNNKTHDRKMLTTNDNVTLN